MNDYTAMMQRQQDDYNKFPIGAAFGKQQFREMMEKWGLTEADTDKIISLGAGCFIRREDRDAYTQMCLRHKKEREDAIAGDKTGEGFIYQMFRAELENHEYSYTGDADDALAALGITLREVCEDKRLFTGLNKALSDVRGEAE